MDVLSATGAPPPSAGNTPYPVGVEPDEDEFAVDDRPFWSTPKVLGLVAVVALFAGLISVQVTDRLSSPSEESVDVGFLQDMIFHHEQAIQIGLIGSDNASDHVVRHFAQEALVAQQYEIGYMTALLEDWGHGTGDPDRDSMVWMGMPTPLAVMPGIIDDDRMAEFRSTTGSEADRMFIELMNEHHRGGIHMAEDAAERAEDPRVRELAARMARNQAAEIGEYTFRAETLGFGSVG